MAVYRSKIDPASDSFRRNREEMLELVAEMRDVESRAVERSNSRADRFHERGQLLPRERIAHLLDPGAPVLEIQNIAGYEPGDEGSLPGGGVIAVIGYVSGTRCIIVANDSGIDAGAMTTPGGWKTIRCEDLSLENRLPIIFLVESAGANLLTYRVEMWGLAGRTFYNQAKISAAGIPVITVLHGSGTAGGAYYPGMSDIIIGVKGNGRAFLAGPPLLKAATGEVADAQELGGVEMHSTVSGLVEYVAEDDADALRICREAVARMHWDPGAPPRSGFDAPLYDPDELAGVVPVDPRQPYDAREVIARLADGSDFLDFKPDYGPMTVCAEGSVMGYPVGFIANNGVLDNAGSGKATHFIQRCTMLGTPLVFLQNINGYMVGVDAERGGMIKNGSKMIQAVSNADVPRFTLMIGASFGAGNYGMCGVGYDPRLVLTWPNARAGVMGGEQAAGTMRVVAEERAARKGEPVDEEQMEAFARQIVDLYSAQESAFVTSGRQMDDGMIDPRDSRRVLGFGLAMAEEGDNRKVNPLSFGVGRI